MFQDGTSDFLPKLPSLSRAFASLPDNSEETHDDSKRVKDQSQLNFLLIGTCDGNMYLSVFGLFSCGVTNINSYMSTNDKKKYTSVLNAELSADMKSMFVLVAVDAEKFYPEPMKEENEIPKKDYTRVPVKGKKKLPILSSIKISNYQEKYKRRELKLVILDTRILSSRSRELHALSQKQGHIISLMDYLSETMRSIIEAWENIYLLEIESKLSKHAESLPESSLSADLLELLLFGAPTDSLGDFLLNEVNDKAIKKLGHSIELSHSNIQKLILKHLLSVGQNLAYHLAEMKGMAKLSDRFKVLGLEEEAVAEAFSAAGAFLIKSTEVQLVIDESMKRYKAFFRWLYAIILRFADDRVPDLTMSDINQQDLDFIAEYLQKLDIQTDEDGFTKRHCFLDRLGQYLDNRDLTTPSESENDNQWQKLLEVNPCLQNHCSVVKRCKNTSLVQQHEHLEKALSKVFRTPEYAIGNMFQLKKIVNIADTSFKKITMCSVDDNTIIISFIKLTSPLVFHMVKVAAEGNSCEAELKTVTFKSEDRLVMKCLDVQFYHSESLSVLFEEQDDNKNAVIAQIKSKYIYENCCSLIDADVLKNSIAVRQIPDFVASNFAVSGSRKVAVVLSSGRRKVRLFEMEAEDEDEEEEMSPIDPAPSMIGVQKEGSLSEANGVLVVKLPQNNGTECEEDSVIEIECS